MNITLVTYVSSFSLSYLDISIYPFNAFIFSLTFSLYSVYVLLSMFSFFFFPYCSSWISNFYLILLINSDLSSFSIPFFSFSFSFPFSFSFLFSIDSSNLLFSIKDVSTLSPFYLMHWRQYLLSNPFSWKWSIIKYSCSDYTQWILFHITVASLISKSDR